MEVKSEPKKDATFRVKRSERKVFHEHVERHVETEPVVREKVVVEEVVSKQRPTQVVRRRKPLPQWQDIYVEEEDATPPPATSFGGGIFTTQKKVHRSSSTSSSSGKSSLTDFIVVERPYLEEWRQKYKIDKEKNERLTVCNNDYCWETHTAQCNDEECWDNKSNMVHYHKGGKVIYGEMSREVRSGDGKYQRITHKNAGGVAIIDGSSDSYSSSDYGGGRVKRRHSSKKVIINKSNKGGEVVISQESSKHGQRKCRKGYGRKLSDLFKDESSSFASSSSGHEKVKRRRSRRVSGREIRVISGESSSSSSGEGIGEKIRDFFDGSDSSSSRSGENGGRRRRRSPHFKRNDVSDSSSSERGGKAKSKSGIIKRIKQNIHEIHSDSSSDKDKRRAGRSPIRKAHDYDNESDIGRIKDMNSSEPLDKGHETCDECECCIRPCSRAQGHAHSLILGDDYCERHRERMNSTTKDTFISMQADRRIEDYEKNRRRGSMKHVIDHGQEFEESVYREDFDPKKVGEVWEYENRNLKDSVKDMYQYDGEWETTTKQTYIEYEADPGRNYKDKNTKDHIIFGSDKYKSHTSYDDDYKYHEVDRCKNFKHKNTKDHVNKVFSGSSSMERRDDYGTWDVDKNNDDYHRNREKGLKDKIKFGDSKFSKTTSYDRDFKYREVENNVNYKKKNTKDHLMDTKSEYHLERKNEYGNFDHSTVDRVSQNRNASTICFGDDKSRIRRSKDYGVFTRDVYVENSTTAERNKRNAEGKTVLGGDKSRFNTSYGNDFTEKKIIKSKTCSCNNCPNCHVSSRTRKLSCPKCVTETTTGKIVSSSNKNVTERGRSRQRSDVHYHIRKSPSPTRRNKEKVMRSSIVFGSDDGGNRYKTTGLDVGKKGGRVSGYENNQASKTNESSSHFEIKQVCHSDGNDDIVGRSGRGFANHGSSGHRGHTNSGGPSRSGVQTILGGHNNNVGYGGQKSHQSSYVVEYDSGGASKGKVKSSYHSNTERHLGNDTDSRHASSFQASSHQIGQHGNSSSHHTKEYQGSGKHENNTFTKQKNVQISSVVIDQDTRNAARNNRLQSLQSNWSFGGMSAEDARHDRFKPNHRINHQRNRSQIFW